MRLKDLDIDANPSKETEVAVETQAAVEESLRRSQRDRKLTEKGQELYDSETKKLQHRFTTSYDKWKVLAKEMRKAIASTVNTLCPPTGNKEAPALLRGQENLNFHRI